MAKGTFDLVRVNRTTKERLDELKAPGQSYDGLITQLLDFLEHWRPNLPHEGPPLPHGMGVSWPVRRKAKPGEVREGAPQK